MKHSLCNKHQFIEQYVGILRDESLEAAPPKNTPLDTILANSLEAWNVIKAHGCYFSEFQISILHHLFDMVASFKNAPITYDWQERGSWKGISAYATYVHDMLNNPDRNPGAHRKLATKEQTKDRIAWIITHEVEALANPGYQERVWLKGEGPEVDDFEDACSYLLEYTQELFSGPMTYEALGIKDIVLLQQLYTKVDQYLDDAPFERHGDYDVEVILADPKWHEIQKLAQLVCKNFLNIKQPHELETL